ncbi:hypothetical protein CRYUN_Cryun04dG0028800 [Craigia yunnanensis]
MVEPSSAEYVELGENSSPKLDKYQKVSIIPLVFLIFYEVSGGPFGVEDSIQAACPLLALLGFLLVPFIWSIPEALITAELGWMKWLSGVIDNALYPVLFLDYLKSAIPALEGGLPRTIAVLFLTLALTYMGYRGLTIVGWVAILLGVFSLLPFIFMGIVAIPKMKPSRWLVADLGYIDWGLYLNTLFWNLNYWDSISTLAGEQWTDGYFSDIAKMLGGVWLLTWIQAAAALSNMGMFLSEMSSDSFQLEGMASRGMLPDLFAKRSRYGTPLVGILFSASGVLLLSWLSFHEILGAENFLYCFGMIRVYSICKAKDRPSSRIKAIQDTCWHGWSNFNVSLFAFLVEQPSQLKYIEWPSFQSTLKTAILTLVLVAGLIVALSSVDSVAPKQTYIGPMPHS